MALTQEHVLALTKPFSAADHEFIRGFVYISELAITTRLDEVDPSWTFEVLSNVQRDRQMVATARMTLSEVFRDGVGMQSMEYLTDYDKATRTKTYRLDLDGNKIDAGEAEKSAATDALRRCARLFGIGRYLLDNPPKVITDDYGNVKDRKAFDEWLAGQQKAHADKWKYNPPSKIAGHIEPEPESEALPKAAGAENEAPPSPFSQSKKVETPLNSKKPRRGATQSDGLGPAFAEWTKKHNVNQAAALAAMNVKYLSEWASSVDEMLDLLRNHFHTRDDEGGEA